MNEGIIPVQDNEVLRGNANSQLLELYEMKDQFALLMSSAETTLNKLELAIRYSKTDSMPYISYHQHLCEKLKYALEMREKLEDFIENAEQHAIFAGIYRGWDYPQALEYIKDVVNPDWRKNPGPEIVYDGSYLFEDDTRDFDYYWGEEHLENSYDFWDEYYSEEDLEEEKQNPVTQHWYGYDDPWEIAYNSTLPPKDPVANITWQYLQQSIHEQPYLADFIAPQITVEELIRKNAIENADDAN